jgi:Carboxypeptidase regulatory-like domain
MRWAHATRVLRDSTLAIASLLVASTALCAQSPERSDMPRDVSVAFVGVQVTQALEQLATLSGMSLVWGGDLAHRADSLRATRARVSCRMRNAGAERVLSCITREAGLDWYRLSSGTYVVVERAERPAVYATLSGLVLDATSLAPIPSARIRLSESDAPRLAGAAGEFAFDRLFPGRYGVIVQAIGYRPWRGQLDVAPSGRERRRVLLQRVDALPAPIIINGLTLGDRSVALGTTQFADTSASRWLRAPAFFFPGAPTLLGVSRRDGTGDLHVQGGEVGELPWRLDGIPLYDASMLSGLLGSVAAPAIEQVTVRRAGFGARDGSFTAGVIDLAHAVGAERVHTPSAVVELDPLAASARVTTPLTVGDVRLRTMVAARQGLWPWTAPPALARAFREWNTPDALLMQRLSGLTIPPDSEGLDASALRVSDATTHIALTELHAAVRAEFGDFQRLDVSAYSGTHGIATDAVSHDTVANAALSHDAYAWNTSAMQARHVMLLGARVTQTVQVRAMQHELAHDGWLQMTSGAGGIMTGAEGNTLREIALSAEWTRAGSADWELRWGADATQTSALMRLANAVLRPLDAAMRTTRGTVWGETTRRLGAEHWLDLGLRVTQLARGGVYPEPRIALRAEGERSGFGAYAWRLSAGGYRQFVNQFDVATTMPVALVPSVRFWLPANAATGVPLAWHVAFESSVRPAHGWELRGEMYGKWQPVLLAFDYGALFDSVFTAAPLTASRYVQTAHGYAAGAGVRAMRDARVGSWPVRLALSADAGLARRTYPSRFGGTLQPTPWLEPLRALITLEVEPARGVVLAVRTRGVWGRTWALRQTYYDLFGASGAGTGLPLSAPGTMERPAILDADIGATFTRRVGAMHVAIGGSLQNAFDRRNVLDYGLRRSAATGIDVFEMVPRYLPSRQLALTFRIAP